MSATGWEADRPLFGAAGGIAAVPGCARANDRKRPVADIRHIGLRWIMLDLDDPRWAQLSHAYGSAADIPELLRQLARETEPKPEHEVEPWFTLWSSLCHQGDVFEASYAAVPHIVAIACGATGPIDFDFFQLPTAIEIARHNGSGPQVPTYLAEAYDGAVSGLTECVALHRREEWDEPMLLSALSAQAVAQGHHRVAEAIMILDQDLITRLVALDFEPGSNGS